MGQSSFGKRRTGRGYSSLAIAGGRIYTLGDAPSTGEDQDEFLICFDQADGKQLWKTKTGVRGPRESLPGKVRGALPPSTVIGSML